MKRRARFATSLFLAVLFAAGAVFAEETGSPADRGEFLDLGGGRIHYEECGAGPEAIVLLHDGLLHSVVWDGVWNGLCGEFRVVRAGRR